MFAFMAFSFLWMTAATFFFFIGDPEAELEADASEAAGEPGDAEAEPEADASEAAGEPGAGSTCLTSGTFGPKMLAMSASRIGSRGAEARAGISDAIPSFRQAISRQIAAACSRHDDMAMGKLTVDSKCRPKAKWLKTAIYIYIYTCKCAAADCCCY